MNHFKCHLNYEFHWSNVLIIPLSSKISINLAAHQRRPCIFWYLSLDYYLHVYWFNERWISAAFALSDVLIARITFNYHQKIVQSRKNIIIETKRIWGFFFLYSNRFSDIEIFIEIMKCVNESLSCIESFRIKICYFCQYLIVIFFLRNIKS